MDITHKYADNRWLTERANGDMGAYRMRHFLYHFGHDWYRVQLLNPTGRNIQEQKFQPNGKGCFIDVYSYTLEKCHDKVPYWIRELDPESPAILYRYPGSEKERYGAAGLCKLLYHTDDPAVGHWHQLSILPPDQRWKKIVHAVEQHFGVASPGEVPIVLSKTPLKVHRGCFPLPDLRFGRNAQLHIKRHKDDGGVPLSKLGPARMGFLKESGTYVTTPLDTQYILMPASLPSEIQDDFLRRVTEAVKAFYLHPYRPQPVLYEDKGNHSLRSQVQAIRSALRRANVKRGYVLLVLPENVHPKLHNYVKRTLWPHLQFQCARVKSNHPNKRGIQDFYTCKEVNGQTRWVVDQNQEHDFTSYLRNLALGILLINRKWPFMLAESLHYDLYIGIDVLNNMAGFTFLYPAAGIFYFCDYPSKQKEKLSRRQIEEVVYEQLGSLLRDCTEQPRSIVFLRDGRSYISEQRGAHCAIKRLQVEGLLGSNLVVGTVEVHKQSAVPLRLFDVQPGEVRNPKIGIPFTLNDREGFVCTTGYPFSIRGTVHPLQLVVVDGPLKIDWILEDALAQAVLSWSAPDRCSWLPVTISLCDLFLEPIAGGVDEEEALYGEDEIEDSEEEL